MGAEESLWSEMNDQLPPTSSLFFLFSHCLINLFIHLSFVMQTSITFGNLNPSFVFCYLYELLV
jgi:hypothetical protein